MSGRGRGWSAITLQPGQRFGSRVVIGLKQMHNGRRGWAVRCACGKVDVVPARSLNSGRAQSCGCIGRKQAALKITTHGHTAKGARSSTYWSWRAMVDRCTRPKNPNWLNYGGRGIVVCERWRKFESFLADMGERPAGLSLDRINVNGNYEPGNCRWSTFKEQHANRRKVSDVPAEFWKTLA